MIVKKYVLIDLANFSKVVASEAKPSLWVFKRLLRRQTPRNDSLPEKLFKLVSKRLDIIRGQGLIRFKDGAYTSVRE
jgi:hypothetical protein